ncbi:MAG: hypothetical protein HYW45_00730 [Candidatus Daviesbacteria bacterium]|nr:MAG: hypothetical protein HYW45_00730 [Candidatus Daviesbacteria bacterium]
MISNLIKTTTFKWLMLVLLLSIPSFSTLLQPGYFGMHDDLQVMRIWEMDFCFRDGQIPCRWVPDMGFGFGYPLFNFYPVMPYYLGELIYKFVSIFTNTMALIVSVKILFILSFLVSAVSMFFLGRKFWGNLGGLLSALFYVYAPYHSVDVYVRGAMAESWSLAWTPAVFLAIYLSIQKPILKNILFLAVSTGLFLTSHNPMALVFTPLMAVWALLWIWQERKLSVIIKLVVAALWGWGLSAFFSLPVLLEGKNVHLETLFIGYFNYLAHFVDLNQLFISTFWGYGGSIWGPSDGMSFQIGWLHWGTVLACLIAGALLWRKERQMSLILFLFGLSFWGAAFLMHPRSNFIWEKITILQTLQFPWRLLAVTIFSSSFVAGSLVALPLSKKLRSGLAVVMVVALLVLYQGFFKIERPIPLTDQEKLSGALWDLQRTAGIFDYLPKTAKFPPGSAALETAEILEGQALVTNFQRGTNWLFFNIESSSSATVRLPVIDFPIWKVFLDQKQISFDNKNDLGQPTFVVPAGKHTVFAKLFDSPIRSLANIISFLSLSAVFIAVYKLIKKP